MNGIDDFDEDYRNGSHDSETSPRQGWQFKQAFGKIGHVAKSTASKISDGLEESRYRMERFVERTDEWAASNKFIGKSFDFRKRSAKLSVEMRGGTITFLMVAFVLAVNPQILGATGGTCNAQELCSQRSYDLLGNACLYSPSRSPEAEECLGALRKSLITATAASSLVACFIMGYFANLPLALCPGMGINIYVAYQIVGQGNLTYEQAMTAIFLEGWLFIVLSLSGIRGALMRHIPSAIAYAASAGIGLLLAFTGLRNLGVIVFDSNTLVALGGCPENDRLYLLTVPYSLQEVNFTTDTTIIDAIDESGPNVYGCETGVLRSATLWLGISGGLLMALLQAWGVNGSIFIGIAFVTIISWIPGHGASYLGSGSSTPGGEYRMDVFKHVVAAPSLSQTGLEWDWSAINTGSYWLALFTFLYIDLLDCTGTLLSMASLLDDRMAHDAEEQGKKEFYKPFMNEKREFFGQQWAFLADGIGIIVGSLMGVTPLTVYMESAAGIEDGARTGIAAIVMSFFFFVSLFFSPILSSIPPYATGPALILVGVMLMTHVDRIHWDDPVESIPAFLTILLMPLTLSVAYGIIAGIVTYIILHLPNFILSRSRNLAHSIKKRYFVSDHSDSIFGGNSDAGGSIDIVIDEFPSPTASFRSQQQQIRRRGYHRKYFGTGSLPRSDSETDLEGLDDRLHASRQNDDPYDKGGRLVSSQIQRSPMYRQNQGSLRSVSMSSIRGHHGTDSRFDRHKSSRQPSLPGRPQKVIIRSSTMQSNSQLDGHAVKGGIQASGGESGGAFSPLFGGGQLLDLDLDADDDDEERSNDARENDVQENAGDLNNAAIKRDSQNSSLSDGNSQVRNANTISGGTSEEHPESALSSPRREKHVTFDIPRDMRRSCSMPDIVVEEEKCEENSGAKDQLNRNIDIEGSINIDDSENMAPLSQCSHESQKNDEIRPHTSSNPEVDSSKEPVSENDAVNRVSFTDEDSAGHFLATDHQRNVPRPDRTLRRVESAAALRLRGLFEEIVEGSDVTSIPISIPSNTRNNGRQRFDVEVIRMNSAPEDNVLGQENSEQN